MGLFSFLKNAGAKLFGKKAEKNEEEEKLDKIIALKEAVLGLELPITEFEVDVDGDNVKVSGEVESQEIRGEGDTYSWKCGRCGIGDR